MILAIETGIGILGLAVRGDRGRSERSTGGELQPEQGKQPSTGGENAYSIIGPVEGWGVAVLALSSWLVALSSWLIAHSSQPIIERLLALGFELWALGSGLEWFMAHSPQLIAHGSQPIIEQLLALGSGLWAMSSTLYALSPTPYALSFIFLSLAPLALGMASEGETIRQLRSQLINDPQTKFGVHLRNYLIKLKILELKGYLKGLIVYPFIGIDVFPAQVGKVVGINNRDERAILFDDMQEEPDIYLPAQIDLSVIRRNLIYKSPFDALDVDTVATLALQARPAIGGARGDLSEVTLILKGLNLASYNSVDNPQDWLNDPKLVYTNYIAPLSKRLLKPGDHILLFDEDLVYKESLLQSGGYEEVDTEFAGRDYETIGPQAQRHPSSQHRKQLSGDVLGVGINAAVFILLHRSISKAKQNRKLAAGEGIERQSQSAVRSIDQPPQPAPPSGSEETLQEEDSQQRFMAWTGGVAGLLVGLIVVVAMAKLPDSSEGSGKSRGGRPVSRELQVLRRYLRFVRFVMRNDPGRRTKLTQGAIAEKLHLQQSQIFREFKKT
jgi:hypothetical protein